MDILIYFVTVFPIGAAFLGIMAWRDSKTVPTGENFMPTLEEMKDFL